MCSMRQSKNVSNCPYDLNGYSDIERVLHGFVDTGILTESARLCLMAVALKEINNPVTHRGVDFIGFNESAGGHKFGAKKPLSRP